MGTRERSVRRPGSLALWLEGPPFLLQERATVQASGPVVVHKALCTADTVLDPEVGTLEKLIEVTPTLYHLKKRCAYLVAFTEFVAKTKRNTFTKPILDATYYGFPKKRSHIVFTWPFVHFLTLPAAVAAKLPFQFKSDLELNVYPT